MSAHAVILLLCALLLVFGVAIVWLIRELVSTKKNFAAEKVAHGNTAQSLATTSARLSEIEKKGRAMYLELQTRAYQAESRSYIMTCLEKKIADLVSHAASMNAKRFAEEKKAVAAGILEFLLAVLFPASCGRASGV
jgi:hypothetical protein